MANKIDHIDSLNLLLLQEKDCLGLTLTEDCDQNIGACDFTFATRLNMKYRPLQHPLETQGRLGLAVSFTGRY